MANVQFATDWKSAGGRQYKAGTVTTIDDNDARSLATRGILRVVPTPAATDTQAPKKENKTNA